MQAFQKDLRKFEGLNAQVVGISTDSLETHKKFSDEYKLQFPLIADVSEQIRKLYAPGRITYLIDNNGIIQLIQEGVPRNKDFLKAIKRLDKGQ
jgi:peroxiredoxin Q/BCP